MRTDLIPQEAKEEIAEQEAGLLAEETDGKGTSEQSSSKIKRRKRIPKTKRQTNARTAKIVVGEYSFDNPNGKIFSAGQRQHGRQESCLDLHGCLKREGSHVIELLYEITLDGSGMIARRGYETGEVEWYCVAYQAGGGWKATATKEGAGQ